jgi:hypothetical protein
MQKFEKRLWFIMSNRDKEQFLDRLVASEKAISFTTGKTRADLDQDELLALVDLRIRFPQPYIISSYQR